MVNSPTPLVVATFGRDLAGLSRQRRPFGRKMMGVSVVATFGRDLAGLSRQRRPFGRKMMGVGSVTQ